ncbi:hypothetical protein PFICI_11129 [Pestalotiopsis fici W106-1]|uniref:Carboxylic ester hydrolase n=1 Tax=Pestalotiopsis fici (strain W106-1 / CGMCC3.15140) TaxID=1229662 RepID=W3WTT1_PESFW|nr:uncharacterized protein PFICI_11129 [Pestalotiopsis fici W106-1]ETS77255.1 hypothetical protein PFICI_11129 [Pestalotiopsis fici W106-1]
MMHLRNLAIAIGALATIAHGAKTLQTVTGWGSLESSAKVTVQLYVPDQVATSPAVVFALHGCGGSGSEYYQREANYGTYAEEKGFLVVYPSSKNDSNCWDVSSTSSLTHDGGSQSQALAQVASYLQEQYNADPDQIFVTGSSSGCMMTNVVMAVYPDVFKAASCYSGVAAGCLAGSPGNSPADSNHTCPDGDVHKTGAQWAEQVRAMYPEYNGTYGRMQTWHGTADNLVFYANLAEQLKEWSALLNVSFTKNVTDYPTTGYTRMVYGDGTTLVGYSAQGVGHTVPVHPKLDLAWFGLS